MPGIDIYDDSYVQVVSDPGDKQEKLLLKNEFENQVCFLLYDFRDTVISGMRYSFISYIGI